MTADEWQQVDTTAYYLAVEMRANGPRVHPSITVEIAFLMKHLDHLEDDPIEYYYVWSDFLNEPILIRRETWTPQRRRSPLFVR